MEETNNNPKNTDNSKEKPKLTDRLRRIGDSFLLYLAENPGAIIPFASIIFGGANLLINCRRKRNDDCLVKDTITNENYLLKHPLSNSEILELSERMNSGETKGEALSSMELLREEKRRK